MFILQNRMKLRALNFSILYAGLLCYQHGMFHISENSLFNQFSSSAILSMIENACEIVKKKNKVTQECQLLPEKYELL